jgi:hypothetical protein
MMCEKGSCIGFYQNGVYQIGSSFYTNIIAGTAGSLSIGAQTDNVAATRFEGDIDNIRVYNRVLSGSELAYLTCNSQAPDMVYLNALGLMYNFDFQSSSNRKSQITRC